MYRKAQAYMIKWIVYSIVLAAIISSVVYLQSNTYALNSETFGLENEIMFQRAINAVYAPDPITGIKTAPNKISNEMLTKLFRSEKKVSLRVIWKNKTYYSDKEQFTIMAEEEVLKYDQRVKKKNIEGEEFELRIAMQK